MSKITKILISFGLVGFVVYLISNSVASHAGQCVEMKNNLQSDIQSAAQCNTNEDCASYIFSCAFGCDTVVNKNEISRLIQRASEYARQCHHFCPDCAVPSRAVQCLNNICQTERK